MFKQNKKQKRQYINELLRRFPQLSIYREGIIDELRNPVSESTLDIIIEVLEGTIQDTNQNN